MKKRINRYLLLLVLVLLACTSQVEGQETRLSTTLKVHPWVKLPVVVSTDVQGGLQSVGALALSENPADELAVNVPEYKRTEGMVVSVIDLNANNRTRYFTYTSGKTWQEVVVLQQWTAGNQYLAGDAVIHEGNYYTANADFTSDTSFKTDSARWNSWGGKDAEYDVKTLFLGKDTLTSAAVKEDVVADEDKKHTLATVSYVDEVGASTDFDGSKAITRPGWEGVTGMIPGTDNVADFLKKVFYPVSTPLITTFNYNGVTAGGQYSYQSADELNVVTDHTGTITIPYGEWNKASGLTFNFEITNRSLADGSEDTPVEQVRLLVDGVEIDASVLNSMSPQISGNFMPEKSSFATDIDFNQSSVLSLQVEDGAANRVALNLNITFVKAQGVEVTNAWLASTSGGSKLLGEGTGTQADPYLIERTGADKTYYVEWGLKFNDDTQADVLFEGTLKPEDLTAVSMEEGSSSFEVPNSSTAQAFRVGVSAKGDVAQDLSASVYSAYYLLQDQTYCGFLNSDVEPSESQLKGLPKHSLKTAEYYQADGLSLKNSTGSSGFFTWAIPTYTPASDPAPAFSKRVFYEAAGTWYENFNINTYYVKMTPPGGGEQSWYWVCIYKASTGNGGSIKVKLSN